MLSYRHLFHAGNFADVFKHALLVRLLIALGKKETPFCYLDTHAGAGRYDLAHAWAQKAREYENGIGRLWARQDVPHCLRAYVDVVRAENADGRLRFYPGSTLIARRLVRPNDRIVLSELNKRDFAELKMLFGADRQVALHCMDGYQSLKAFLPPKERRGLVLLDSSFDRAKEFDRIVDALVTVHARWATGTFAIWYPLMQPSAMRRFSRDIAATGVRKILQLELALHPAAWKATMRGCGMLLVNPPWTLAQEAQPMLNWLRPALAAGDAGLASVRWLVSE